MVMLNNNLMIKTLIVGNMFTNCYIVYDKMKGKAFIIDPGAEADNIKKYLDSNKLNVEFIIHTHGHIDHIIADAQFEIPIYIHKLDREYLLNSEFNLSSFLDSPFKLANKDIRALNDGDKVEFIDSTLKIIHTPGHTPGGICILLNKALFSGDTLFAEGIGRTDFPGASHELLVDSIKEKLLKLPDDVVVYPGHGEPTTIGREKKTNPFLM